MAIVRWEPFRDLVGLQERMNRMFDQSFRGLNRAGDEDWALGGSWAPAVDIYEHEGNIVLKADVQGSAGAIVDALEKLSTPAVKLKVIHSSVGAINETDVMLAAASNAIVIGFSIRPDSKAADIAQREGVDIRLYNIIYNIIDDIKAAMEGLLEPTLKEKILGHAEVRQTFHVSKVGTIAGCSVTDGVMTRQNDGVRVLRDNVVVYTGKLHSLKRFKDDVREVQTGYECGIGVENFNDIKVGDVVEAFIVEKVAAKL